MSYGNYSINEDIKRGMNLKIVARKINMYYPDINKDRALKMAKTIKRYGENARLDWSNKRKAKEVI